MTDDDQFSNGPPLVAGSAMSASLEAEEKAMKSGRGGIIAVLALFACVLVAGLVFALRGDGNEAYEALGRNANAAKGELFDGFWVCVFQRGEEIESNSDLSREIHERATNGRGRFGRYVATECAPMLGQLEERLRALIPPQDMVTEVGAMVSATETLRGAVSDYVAYLDTVEAYVESDAQSRVTQIARGWFEFRTASVAFNDALRERVPVAPQPGSDS